MRRYCPGSRTRCPLKAHLFWTLKYRLSVASCTVPDDITNTQEREPVGDDGRFQSTPFEPLAFQARVVQWLETHINNLANWRVRRIGPQSEPNKLYRRGVGHRVLYRHESILGWLDGDP